MTESTESVEEPTRRFTEIRQFAAGDRYIGFTTCIECGTGIFIDPEDRKNDIHPIAAHIEWHDNLVVWFEKVDGLAELLAGGIPTNMLKELARPAAEALRENNTAELTKEVTDSGRHVQRTSPDPSDDRRGGVQAQVPQPDDVPDRREVGTDRPQGPRPGPVPGVPREGRGKGPGNAGQPRQG